MKNLNFFKKMFPNAVNALPIKDEELTVINSGTDREKLTVYNRVYRQNIQMCECPDLHLTIADELIVAVQYQNMSRVTEVEYEEDRIKPKLKHNRNAKSNK